MPKPGFSARAGYRVLVGLVGVVNLVVAYLADGVLVWTGLAVGVACLTMALWPRDDSRERN